MRGLYPIVDLDTLTTRRVAPLDFARAVLGVKPALLQLRAKHQAPRDVLALLVALKPLCQSAGTLLFANDRPDLALLAAADGVHVGQCDLPLAAVRSLPGKLRVGVSTHNMEELEAALSQHPDYVAFGPIFDTVSKEQPSPTLGLTALVEAAERAARARVPLVAIGGVCLAQAPAIARTGAIGAVIGDLLTDGDSGPQVQIRAQALHSALGG